MTILGIETSCDETGAAVLTSTNSKIQLLSNSLATSLAKHAVTGGIIPEIAAREQVAYILPVIEEALFKGLGYSLSAQNAPKPPIDAIAVTYGPGLIGSLLVGVETAKTLSLLWNIPLIPINHLYGHIYANFIEHTEIELPALSLVVSGGHTDLVLVKEHMHFEVIGGTRDDAAGEAFDKIGRILGLSYPAGPVISTLARKGDPKAFLLPRPMIGSHDFDFSFSGLKTSVFSLVRKNNWNFSDTSFAEKNQQLLFDLCASVEHTIVDVLVKKTIKAAQQHQVKSILMGGGVACNEKLQTTLAQTLHNTLPETSFFVPSKDLCTDNAAMIAAAGVFSKERISWKDLTANPELYY